MATKVTVSGNYIYFTPAGGKPRKGATKDVKIYVDDDNADTFHVLGLFNEGNYIVSTADDNLLASDDTPYTAETFITFADSNTGNFNTGGATPLTYKTYRALLSRTVGNAPTAFILDNTLGYIPALNDDGISPGFITLIDAPYSDIKVASNKIDVDLSDVTYRFRIIAEDDNLITFSLRDELGVITNVDYSNILIEFFINNQ